MNKPAFAIVLLLMAPALKAQQNETKQDPPQAETQAQPAPQPSTENQSEQNSLPAAIRPGHPLDPADVDILTGKRDREIEAARQAALPVMMGGYGGYAMYGDYYWMSGRLGRVWDIPMLPLTRISNPFFFGLKTPHGFGRGGFRGR
jgi:hypothetical protein